MKAFFRAKQIDEQIEALSHMPARPSSSASGDARLIRDLERVYDHSSYTQHLAYSLQQVEQGLQSQQTQRGTSENAHHSIQRNLPANHPSAHQRKDSQNSVSRPFLTALGSIAAVLCVAVLIGGLVFTLQAAQRGKTLGPTPRTPVPQTTLPHTPQPTKASVGKAGALQSIHMFDALTGWATTSDTPRRVLHTTTGATQWENVSPVILTSSSILAGTDFFSASTAQVVVASPNGSLMYRTNDGGQTWQKALLPGQVVGSCQITFLDTRNGWLLIGQGAAAGSEAVHILHTSDGGANWQVISATSPTNNPPTALPFGGDKSGISFASPTTGWVTGFSPTPNFIWLYVTHDGGASWQHQNIPLPGNIGDVQIMALTPVFSNATTGILPVVFTGTTTQTIIYATQDGGASWHSTTAVPINATAQLVDFVDAAHGWMANNTDNSAGTHSTVYRTSDGGQHWTPYTVTLGADLEMLTFASPTRGWAIDATQSLYQTTDGGQTWTKVPPSLVS